MLILRTRSRVPSSRYVVCMGAWTVACCEREHIKGTMMNPMIRISQPSIARRGFQFSRGNIDRRPQALLALAILALCYESAESTDDDMAVDIESGDRAPFDFVGLFFLLLVVGLGFMGAWKLAGRGDMFGESGYLAEQERLAREEAARQAEEEKAKETEFQRR